MRSRGALKDQTFTQKGSLLTKELTLVLKQHSLHKVRQKVLLAVAGCPVLKITYDIFGHKCLDMLLLRNRTSKLRPTTSFALIVFNINVLDNTWRCLLRSRNPFLTRELECCEIHSLDLHIHMHPTNRMVCTQLSFLAPSSPQQCC